MKLIIEEYQYRSEEAKALLREIAPLEQEGGINIDLVGYYYSHKVEDTVFFLPKVVVDDKQRLFHKYDPERLIDLTRAKEEKYINDDDFDFIYQFSVWIYRAISEYRREQESLPREKQDRIVYSLDVINVGTTGQTVYNTFLDIMLSLIRFNEENQDYFTFTLKNIRSGFNKINWTKTISHSRAIVQNDTPVYIDVVNRKKKINYDEELFVIFFSILQHLNSRYGFPVNLAFGYELLTDDEFENYIGGYGVLRLEQIRYKYFSDKLVLLWQLCYDFFAMASNVSSNRQQDDYVLVKNFNIVFEAMIDRLLSDNDKRIERMHLKEQADGKRVDHIYAYDGLIHNQGDIYYIGDSKYYKLGNNPGSESVYKQYTYARNVIQANLNLFNDENGNWQAGEDYLIYLDQATEGYNITPNFFIRAHIEENKDYGTDDLRFVKSEPANIHFRNRLFDRDTLLLQHYDINFLYVLSVYGSGDEVAQRSFKQKAHKLFREMIIREIEEKYQFFSLQLKPTAEDGKDSEDDYFGQQSERDKMDRIVEEKYFHRLLGKAFRPFKEESFLYLSLESKQEFYAENMKLLSDLSMDFNIREYRLGTDPRDEINKFAQLTYGVAAGKPAGNEGETKVYRFEDFGNEVFLVGGYRSGNKNQLEWIKSHKMYNVRQGVERHGAQIIDTNIVSARFLVLYEIAEPEHRVYTIYRINGFNYHTQQWMEREGYERPSGSYIVYSLEEECHFESVNINAMIRLGCADEILHRKAFGIDMPSGWIENEWSETPLFLKGFDIASSCLAGYKDVGKAMVVVNIQDKEMEKSLKGFSMGLFATGDLMSVVREMSLPMCLIYSNKNKHAVYRIVGDAVITTSVPAGYFTRKYGVPLRREGYLSDDIKTMTPEFYLSFRLEKCTDKHFDQSAINMVPEGLTGYDTRVSRTSVLRVQHPGQ